MGIACQNRNIIDSFNRQGIFPAWIWRKTILFAFITLLIVMFVYSSRPMTPFLYSFYVIEILFFFYYGQILSNRFKFSSSQYFVRQIVLIAFIIRVPLCVYYHFSYLEFGGENYYLYLEDIEFYVGAAVEAANNFFYSGSLDFLDKWINVYHIALDDIGCPLYYTIILLFTGNLFTCPVLYLSNCILGSITVVFIYRIAQRHFGEGVARLAVIFCTLNPNMIWWCGSLMKETQMVFLTCWYLDIMDKILFSNKILFKSILPGIAIGMILMLYRSALGALAFASFFLSVLFLNKKIISTSKKIFISIIVALTLSVSIGNYILSQVNIMAKSVEDGGQQSNMEWRSIRSHGNEFAKYAGAAVFAPLIFTIPFPTLTYTHQGQEALMQVAGGNYIKNVLSFFVILSMVFFLLKKTWRQHILIISFTVGYLVILVVSVYAQSGRFHMPIIPFEMMFAAFGISLCQNKPRWKNLYTYALVAEIGLCVFWQWFKLKGQGLI